MLKISFNYINLQKGFSGRATRMCHTCMTETLLYSEDIERAIKLCPN